MIKCSTALFVLLFAAGCGETPDAGPPGSSGGTGSGGISAGGMSSGGASSGGSTSTGGSAGTAPSSGGSAGTGTITGCTGTPGTGMIEPVTLDCGASGVAMESAGPPENRVNYIIVGEGYLEAEQ